MNEEVVARGFRLDLKTILALERAAAPDDVARFRVRAMLRQRELFVPVGVQLDASLLHQDAGVAGGPVGDLRLKSPAMFPRLDSVTHTTSRRRHPPRARPADSPRARFADSRGAVADTGRETRPFRIHCPRPGESRPRLLGELAISGVTEPQRRERRHERSRVAAVRTRHARAFRDVAKTDAPLLQLIRCHGTAPRIRRVHHGQEDDVRCEWNLARMNLTDDRRVRDRQRTAAATQCSSA